jgi:RNA polymerase sigma factor (sigma-70 family)
VTDTRSNNPDKLTDEQRKLAESMLDVVQRIARALKRRAPAPLDEIVSAGYEAAVRAARLFDTAAGVPFVAYALKTVQGRMVEAAFAPLGDKVRTMVRRSDRQKTAAFGSADEDDTSETVSDLLVAQLGAQAAAAFTGGWAEPNPEERLLSHEARQRALAALSELFAEIGPTERAVLEGFYQDDLTIEQVAERTKLSIATTRRTRARLVVALRKKLAARGVVERPGTLEG